MNRYKFERGFNVRRFVIILSALLIVSYGIFNARNLLMGPTLDIFTPSGNIETEKDVLIIKGKATNAAFISLNENPISTDTDGQFEERVLLSPGTNIVEIKAQDRFKKEIVKTMTIYYKQSPYN
jgi:hypothetical protein